MDNKTNTGMGAYNDFCRNLTEGSILYNLDSTNSWGDYLLVANKQVIHAGNDQTYTLLLLGLKKENGQYKPRNLRISMTPDYAKHIPYLKYVGTCKFELLPVISEVNVSVGLVSIYSNTDLRKFTQKLNIRKPQKKRYGNDGKPTIKKCNN